MSHLRMFGFTQTRIRGETFGQPTLHLHLVNNVVEQFVLFLHGLQRGPNFVELGATAASNDSPVACSTDSGTRKSPVAFDIYEREVLAIEQWFASCWRFCA